MIKVTPNFPIFILVILAIFSCNSTNKTIKNSMQEKTLKGRFTHNGDSNFGNNCKLWLAAPNMEPNTFYLAYGFYGDDGGKETNYEGTYKVVDNSVTLFATNQINREWDDSINYDQSKETITNKTISGQLVTQKEKTYIEITLSEKKYKLLMDEKYE